MKSVSISLSLPLSLSLSLPPSSSPSSLSLSMHLSHPLVNKKLSSTIPISQFTTKMKASFQHTHEFPRLPVKCNLGFANQMLSHCNEIRWMERLDTGHPSCWSKPCRGSMILDLAAVATASWFCSLEAMAKTVASLTAQFSRAVWGISSWELSLSPFLLLQRLFNLPGTL